MTRRIVLLLFLLGWVSRPISAQNFGQSLALTFEDDATIQLLQSPDGTPASQLAERISGGLAARFLFSQTVFGGPSSNWLATDFRVQSQSFTVTPNPQACGGHLATVNSLSGGEGTTVTIAAHFILNNQLFTDVFIGNQALGCTGWDTAVVTFRGVQYPGIIQFGGTFNGTVDAPGELPNGGALILFGLPGAGFPGGIAVINGTLRAELSDYTATTVKLRQGIPPFAPQTPDFNPPWEFDQYNTDTTTENRIYNLGCALTSLSMLLNAAGVRSLPAPYGLDDPGNLNQWMLQNVGYDNEGVMLVPTVGSLAKALPKSLKFNVEEHDSLTDPTGAQQFLDNTLSGAGVPGGIGTPVYVGVDDNCAAYNEVFPCHYVTVWGKRNGEFLIADPKPTNASACVANRGTPQTCIRLKLSDYDHFVTYGYITDPPDLSGLTITTAANVELTLISPTGEQTGFDPETQSTVVNISGSGYFVETTLDDNDASIATPTDRLIESSVVTDGQYTVAVTGLSFSVYALDIFVVSEDGSIQPRLTVSGITGPGTVSQFGVQLNTGPVETSTAVRFASIASTLADVTNSLHLGLISNQGIATSLSSELHAADSARARGDCTAVAGVLQAFMQEVQAQTGKAIAPLTGQVLLEDAEYLIDHCGM